MSTARAMNVALDLIGETAGLKFCAIILTLDTPLPEADGLDSYGRSVILVGRHWIGQGPEAEQILEMVRTDFAAGVYPDGVHCVVFAPKASEAIKAAIQGAQDTELLLHGPRNTGKTHTGAAIAMILAEFHLRAGCPAPFLVGWLHDSLLSASTKTGRSLQLPMWGGLWHLKDDSRRAICTLAGKELVAGDFVGCKDEEANQRLRIEVNMVLAEELIASMTDGTGVKEDQWDLARSSTMRLPTPKRIAVGMTNPGGPDTWPYQRWLAGPRPPRLVSVQVPKTDRMTPDEQAANHAVFAYSPTLQKRLSDGEWIMAEQGVSVAEGFNVDFHVSQKPLQPSPMFLLGLGWDGGHSPSVVIGQNINGQCVTYAALNVMSAGVLELIEQQLWPWLKEHAPWALLNGGADLVHIIDPNMKTPGQATITESAERMILAKLGGRIVYGAVRWPPRREAVLRVLAPRHERGRVPLVINPGEDTRLLVEAYQGRWFYEKDPKTDQVNRTGPKKPNSPWADIGDASAYLYGWLLGGELMDVPPTGPIKVESDFSLDTRQYAGMF